MKLTIVIPVYNEMKTIEELLKVVSSVALPSEITEREIVIVDDCSKDGTWQVLQALKEKFPIQLFHHDVNQGKGAALRTGFQKATGDIVIIQDADLEYDPHEYGKVIRPILDSKADVVYGSRFLLGESHLVLRFWHTMINQFLTLCSNALSDMYVTDMETCYKAFRREIIQAMEIQENRFGVEPEMTAKIAQLAQSKKARVHEVAIAYYGRTHAEGKKIKAKDGVRALWCILKYNETKLARFIKYAMTGLLVALIQFLLMIALVEGFGMKSISQQNIANVISIAIDILCAFLLHSCFSWKYSFSSFGHFLKKLAIFYLVTCVSFAARICLFYLLSSIGIHYLLNTFLGIVLAVILNFIGYDHWVFAKGIAKK